MRTLIIFSDASHDPNTGKAGYSFVIQDLQYNTLHYKSGVLKNAETSQIAEMQTIVNAVAFIHKNFDDVTGLLVVGDCIGCMHNLQRGFKKKNSRKTLKRRKIRDVYIKLIVDKRIAVTFHHVRAHTSEDDHFSRINRWCDLQAKKQIQLRK